MINRTIVRHHQCSTYKHSTHHTLFSCMKLPSHRRFSLFPTHGTKHQATRMYSRTELALRGPSTERTPVSPCIPYMQCAQVLNITASTTCGGQQNVIKSRKNKTTTALSYTTGGIHVQRVTLYTSSSI